MRKYDRNALFNIIVKAILFTAVLVIVFVILHLVTGAGTPISVILSVVMAILAVALFSFLLRHTQFYYAYYSFVSRFLFLSKSGKVYCPCCGKHFEGFRDERFYADSKHFNPDMFSRSRQDVICDFCRSAPRHRIIAQWAEENLDILKGKDILYFAPELSMMLWFRRHNIAVKTADLFDRRTDLRLDLMKLSIPDESEDIIFCNHVLEHVTSYSIALSELRRVIRRGGKLVISFPVDLASDSVIEEKTGSAEERIKLFGQHDHLRVFGKDSRKILEESGFEVETIDIPKMPEQIVPVDGPADYDTNLIFICTRK